MSLGPTLVHLERLHMRGVANGPPAHALCLEGVCSTWEPSDEALKRANKHSARALAERTCVVTNLPRFFHTSIEARSETHGSDTGG